MAQHSPIEWCDHTFNPWWGCTRVSAGCKYCYAAAWAKRYRYDVWGTQATRRLFGERHWHEPIKWNAKAERLGTRFRVFCASMADVFEEHPDIIAERQKLWHLIAQTPMLDWLLLTKRPQNMSHMVPTSWQQDGWPPNAWAMTSVEDQQQAEHRIPLLLNVPALVRGLSVEPLIGPVDLSPWLAAIQWVIVGGESGPHARRMYPDWVRTIRDQCQDFDVAFFFKQWGNLAPVEQSTNGTNGINQTNGTHSTHGTNGTEHVAFQRTSKKAAGRLLDGRTWDELPIVPLSGEQVLGMVPP
jgi:protein gp37